MLGNVKCTWKKRDMFEHIIYCFWLASIDVNILDWDAQFKIKILRKWREKNHYWLITGTRVHVGSRAHAGTSQTPLEPELTTRSHCTSVRVSVDDKWRASQSKPICTSIRRGSQMGINMHIFSRGEAIHLSQNVAPGRWDKRPPERRKGVWGGGVCVGAIQLKYLGD